MIGNLPDALMAKLESDDPDLVINGAVLSGWRRKAKYEECEIVLDMRDGDADGTLDIATRLDKRTNQFIPDIKMVSGCLILKLRKEK